MKNQYLLDDINIWKKVSRDFESNITQRCRFDSYMDKNDIRSRGEKENFLLESRQNGKEC